MEYSAERIIELINSIPWHEGRRVRSVWLKLDSISRREFRSKIEDVNFDHSIIPIIVEAHYFQTSNSLLSDLSKSIEANRELLSKIESDTKLITIVLLSKDSLKIPQISSPITFPDWFPILAGKEDVIYLHDLHQSAQVSLLNSSDIKIEQISGIIFEIEWKLVSRMKANGATSQIQSLLSKTHGDGINAKALLDQFDTHINNIPSSASYRLNAKNKESLLCSLISTILKSSADEMTGLAKKLSLAFDCHTETNIKPTMMGVMMRPTQKQDQIVQNFHSLLIGLFQAYQLMNAAAHAAEYPSYPVDLVESTSRDLVRFLSEVLIYLRAEAQ